MTISQAEKKRLKSLYTKKGRKTERQFLAEGVRLLEESLRFNYLPKSLYFADSRLAERGRELVKKFEQAGVKTVNISARDLSGISETETSQGLLGLFNIPEIGIDNLSDKANRVLLLDNISDPGNVGTLFRSALAFGFMQIIIANETADPFNSKVIRSSAGAIFGLTMIKATAEDILRFKKKNEYKLIVADVDGENLKKAGAIIRKFSRIILALGSEATGVSDNIDSIADIRVRIGHSKAVESLNVSVAGSIIMKELYI